MKCLVTLKCMQRRRKVEKSGGSRFVIKNFLYRKLVVEPKQWRSQEVEVEGQKSPPLSCPSSPPSPHPPSPPLLSPLPSLTAKGVWERYKLAQRGLGRSPSRQRFWCILDQKENFWWNLNSPQWRSQEIGGKFIFPLISILTNSV